MVGRGSGTANEALEQNGTAVVGRIIGMFAIVGVSLGLGVLLVVWGTGMFDEDADIGTAVFGGLTLLMGFAFSAFAGLVVAAVAGHYTAQNFVLKKRSMVTAMVGSGLGHLVLFVAFTLIVVVGVVAMEGDSEEDTGGELGETEEEGSPAEGVPPWRALGMLAAAAVPAALVGLVTAALLFPDARHAGSRREQYWATTEEGVGVASAAPERSPARQGVHGRGPPRESHASAARPPDQREDPSASGSIQRKCPRCGNVVTIRPRERAVCPNCGFSKD